MNEGLGELRVSQTLFYSFFYFKMNNASKDIISIKIMKST